MGSEAPHCTSPMAPMTPMAPRPTLQPPPFCNNFISAPYDANRHRISARNPTDAGTKRAQPEATTPSLFHIRCFVPLRFVKMDDFSFHFLFFRANTYSCSGWMELVVRIVFAFCIVFCFNVIESSPELLELCFLNQWGVCESGHMFFFSFLVALCCWFTEMFKCFVNLIRKRVAVNVFFVLSLLLWELSFHLQSFCVFG